MKVVKIIFQQFHQHTFPPLKSVCGSILAIWDTVERLKSCKSEAQALASQCKDILEHLADVVQPDPSSIPLALMRDILPFQRLLDDILASMEHISRQPTGTFRVLKGLKRLNRDEYKLEQFHCHLDEAAQAFIFYDSESQTELSTAKIQISTSHIESNVQAMQSFAGKSDPYGVFWAMSGKPQSCFLKKRAKERHRLDCTPQVMGTRGKILGYEESSYRATYPSGNKVDSRLNLVDSLRGLQDIKFFMPRKKVAKSTILKTGNEDTRWYWLNCTKISLVAMAG
ncbi:hypothetical protein C8J56DRAFT_900556 [Mycena floridula]|nr:hypothetical protein C8J56DRAFT_900556 [Mycena floridula]